MKIHELNIQDPDLTMILSAFDNGNGYLEERLEVWFLDKEELKVISLQRLYRNMIMSLDYTDFLIFVRMFTRQWLFR